MGTEDTDDDLLFGPYNAELERLGCGARVTIPASRKPSTFLVVDLDGKPIGELPSSLPANALAAVMLLVEHSFEEGVKTGRALARPET